MRRNLIWVPGVAAMVTLTSIASAHLLSFKRARNITAAEARQFCNSFPTCTHYGARSCRRVNAHKIRCIGIVRDRAGGFCTWPVEVRIQRGSNQAFVRSNPQQTADCRPG
jgi:hypothetical protein